MFNHAKGERTVQTAKNLHHEGKIFIFCFIRSSTSSSFRYTYACERVQRRIYEHNTNLMNQSTLNGPSFLHIIWFFFKIFIDRGGSKYSSSSILVCCYFFSLVKFNQSFLKNPSNRAPFAQTITHIIKIAQSIHSHMHEIHNFNAIYNSLTGTITTLQRYFKFP